MQEEKEKNEGIELNAGKNENQKQEKEEYGEGSFSAGMKISSHLEKRICLSLTCSSSSSSTLATYSNGNAALVYHRRLARFQFISFLFFSSSSSSLSESFLSFIFSQQAQPTAVA